MVVNSFIKCGTNIEGTFIQNSLIIKKDLLCRNLSLFVRIWRVWHRTKTKQKRFQIYFTWNKKKQLIIFRQLNTNYSTFVLNSPLTHFFTSPLLPCSTALLWYFSTVSQTSLVLWHCHAMWQCATLTLFYFSIVSLLHCSNSSNVAHAIASTFSQAGTSFVKTSSRYWLRHSWKPYHATGCVIRKTLVTLVTPRTRSSYSKGSSSFDLTRSESGTMLCSTVCRRCWEGNPSFKKDSAWAWIVCLAAATNLAFTVGLIYSFGVLLPVFMDYFKESRENTGKLLNCETILGLACEYTAAFKYYILIDSLLVLCVAITQEEWRKY